MPWGVAAAAVGAAGAIGGGMMQSGAVAGASKQAVGEQVRAREQATRFYQPWIAGGTAAQDELIALNGLRGTDVQDEAMGRFTTSPDYNFRMAEGLRAVDAGAAAKGMLRSGATLKAEQTFGQGLAASSFADHYNRLNALMQAGQQSIAATNGVALNAANNIGQTQASAATAQANIYGNVASGVGDAIGSAMNNYRYNSFMQPSTGSVYTAPASYMSNTGMHVGGT